MASDAALEKLTRIDGVYFNWKPLQGGRADIGFIAEDVGRVLPELADWEDDDVSARALKYDRVTAVAVEGIQEQQKSPRRLAAAS